MNNKGAATLIYMSLIAVIAVLLLTLGYSRYLLALRRTRSYSDALLTGYRAEFEINDLIAKLLGGYLDSDDFDFSNRVTIGDTKLDIEGIEEDNTQTINVTASRPFAVSKIKAVRTTQTSSSINDAELVLALDCTGSMNSDSGTGTSRLKEQKKAALAFVDSIMQSPDADLFKVGVSVFKIDSKWLLTPTFNLSEARDAVDQGFTDSSWTSPACSSMVENTSIGSGFALANTYFRENPPENLGTKRFQVLISDGEPNARMPYPNCPPSVFCPLDNARCSDNNRGWECFKSGGACRALAMDFMRCSLDEDRDPSVDVYAVTVLKNPPRDVIEILQDPRLVKKYYNIEYAYQLSDILQEIFTEISSSFSTLTIKRVIPGQD